MKVDVVIYRVVEVTRKEFDHPEDEIKALDWAEEQMEKHFLHGADKYVEPIVGNVARIPETGEIYVNTIQPK